MRIFPRIRRPSFKPLAQRLRRWRRQMSAARLALLFELLLCLGVLFIVWASGRAAFVVLTLTLGFVGALHFAVQRFLLPRLERYLSPVRYDDRQILFDLGQEARRATDIDHLYSLIVSQIGEALQAANASLFIHDEATGNYVQRASSSMPPVNGRNGATASEPSLTLARDAFVISRLRALTQPLDIGPQDFEAWNRFLASASGVQRTVREKERAALQQIQTRMLMPIKSKAQLVGIMSLGQCRTRHEYDATDKEMLLSVGNQLALVIENARLTERLVADEKLRRELALAAEVQRRLLPARPPECATIELAGFCQPARGVGGDYYDFFQLDDNQVGITIADVAGKGIAAALQMSTVQATLRSLLSNVTAHSQHNAAQAQIIAKMVGTLNRLLIAATGGANYVTFFYAAFDESTRQLAYVNAGHNPPILYRANAAADFQELSCGGLFVGMFEHLEYEQEMVPMQSGDVLIAFTDGLSEALNVQGEEFGEARVKAALTATAHLTSAEICDEVVRRAQAWSVGAPQHDDLTFLVMKVK